MRVKGLLITALFVYSGCSAEMPLEQLNFPGEETMVNSFARFYEEVESSSVPGMKSMGLPVNPSSVINLQEVLLHSGHSEPCELLLQNGFAVFPGSYSTDNPVWAFERLEDSGIPVFVSSGIPLHMLHIFFDQILQQVETDYLISDLVTICTELYGRSITRNDMTGAAYFAVPLSFLDDEFQPADEIAGIVEDEAALMRAHGGFEDSPVFGYQEDYSQYVPRGHYTASRELENYFMAMMYLGRMTFPLKGGSPFGPREEFLVSREDADRLTATAVLMVSDLNDIMVDGQPLRVKWQRLYEITAFFAGFADDLSVMEYQAAAAAAGGEEPSSRTIQSDSFRTSFIEFILEEYGGPGIYSGTGASVIMPDPAGDFDPGDFMALLTKTTGFRLFGQRYTPDSEMMAKFVFPSIGANGQGQQRFMPSGLDVAASFRCEAALKLVQENGSMDYAYYPDTLLSMQAMVDGYSTDEWHSTLYMSWLHSLRLLASSRDQGYPDFMQTDAWDMCTLSTFLSSWAMLRHDTILYAKQSYTAMAGCAPPMDEPVPSAGFVEPVPEVYAELRATLAMARNGLEYYGLLDQQIETRFGQGENLLARLQEIAEKELRGDLLTAEDADFLKGFASYLEGTIAWGGDTREGLETSLIADVHIDQNSSRVLEVASGNLDNCVVIYKRSDGVIEAAMGPVLSYYEFTWPMSDRLTDEAWREMLGGNPERPVWTEGFIWE